MTTDFSEVPVYTSPVAPEELHKTSDFAKTKCRADVSEIHHPAQAAVIIDPVTSKVFAPWSARAGEGFSSAPSRTG